MRPTLYPVQAVKLAVPARTRFAGAQVPADQYVRDRFPNHNWTRIGEIATVEQLQHALALSDTPGPDNPVGTQNIDEFTGIILYRGKKPTHLEHLQQDQAFLAAHPNIHFFMLNLSSFPDKYWLNRYRLHAEPNEPPKLVMLQQKRPGLNISVTAQDTLHGRLSEWLRQNFPVFQPMMSEPARDNLYQRLVSGLTAEAATPKEPATKPAYKGGVRLSSDGKSIVLPGQPGMGNSQYMQGVIVSQLSPVPLPGSAASKGSGIVSPYSRTSWGPAQGTGGSSGSGGQAPSSGSGGVGSTGGSQGASSPSSAVIVSAHPAPFGAPSPFVNTGSQTAKASGPSPVKPPPFGAPSVFVNPETDGQSVQDPPEKS